MESERGAQESKTATCPQWGVAAQAVTDLWPHHPTWSQDPRMPICTQAALGATPPEASPWPAGLFFHVLCTCQNAGGQKGRASKAPLGAEVEGREGG